jgi:GTPase
VSTKKIPTVAIIGRTNVGKSTLFNTLTGRKLAIVEDAPGVTRDRSYALVTRGEVPFTLIDTGGIVGDEDPELRHLVRRQAEIAIQEADLILALFDGLEGVNPLDYEVVELLRRSEKKVLWVINKCESPSQQLIAGEFYALGIDALVFISAAHKVGLSEIVEAVDEEFKEFQKNTDPFEKDETIRVAIVGKPNVGKSTLVNKLVGAERVVTSEIAGTTRDSIDVSIVREGQHYTFVDTAGLRKKARIDDHTVERYSNLRALRSLVQCDVAVLVLDATEGIPSMQDAKIGGLIHERGRSFVIVVNKWDAIEKDHRTVKAYEDAVYEVFKFARYAPIVFLSAATGKRCPALLTAIKEVYEASKIRIQTSELNRVLKVAFERRPPPVYRGEPIKFFFGTQVDAAPPTFVLFLNHPTRINFAYQRYIKNQLRETYPFPGNDIKIHLRKRRDREEAA